MAAAPRRALIVLLALVSVFGSPGVAQAAVSGNTGWTYFTTNGPCVWTQAQMRDDWGKPWAQSYAFYDYWAGGDNTTACADHSRNAPTGRLSVRQDLYFWNTNTNAWTICNQGDWYTNVTPSHVASTEFAWGSRPCFWGHWYYLRGKGSVFINTPFVFGWQGREFGINTEAMYIP